MKPIILHLLLGIGAVAANFGLFLWLLVRSAKSGQGLRPVLDAFVNHPSYAFYWLIAAELAFAIWWPLRMRKLMIRHDPALMRFASQMGWAAVVMSTFFVLIGVLVFIATNVENRFGDQARFVMGLLTTPFTMEFLLVILGGSLLVLFNTLRHRITGDEYVYLETTDEPKELGSIPSSSRAVVHKEKPLDPPEELQTIIAQIEGAFDIGDYEQVAALLMEVPEDHLDTPRFLKFRIHLCEATDRRREVLDLHAKLNQFKGNN